LRGIFAELRDSNPRLALALGLLFTWRGEAKRDDAKTNPKERSVSEKPALSHDPQPLEPARQEHGVSGYTSSAVGGFGEDYSHQVAQGRESVPDSDLSADAEEVSLRRAVQKALAHAHIDAADLRVEVQGAGVTLYGTVQHAFQKSELESLARAVPGVSNLTSRLSALHKEPSIG
jgi:BON domain